jgi:hypothetical protein
MSEMLTYAPDALADYQAAIDTALPSGEHIQVLTDGFLCNVDIKVEWGQVVRKQYVSATFTAVLTNAAIRLVTFKTVKQLNPRQEQKKQTLLAKGLSESDATRKAIGIFGKSMMATVAIPELASMTSYQLSDISSISFKQAKPAQFVKARFGARIVEIGMVTVACPGPLVINSI